MTRELERADDVIVGTYKAGSKLTFLCIKHGQLLHEPWLVYVPYCKSLEYRLGAKTCEIVLSNTDLRTKAIWNIRLSRLDDVDVVDVKFVMIFDKLDDLVVW